MYYYNLHRDTLLSFKMESINKHLSSYFDKIDISDEKLIVYMYEGKDDDEGTYLRGIVSSHVDIRIFDQDGVEYEEEVKKLVKEAFKTGNFGDEMPLFILKTFLEDYLDCAGFSGEDDGGTTLNLSKDPFWRYLVDKYNVKINRPLNIHTFGNKYKKFTSWKNETDRSFGAFTESKKPKNLRNIRGTDRELQKTVRSGKKFEAIMENIVKEVESNNMRTIGIYCRAGHHRSVACAELLKQYVYVKAHVTHKTISK